MKAHPHVTTPHAFDTRRPGSPSVSIRVHPWLKNPHDDDASRAPVRVRRRAAVGRNGASNASSNV